MTTLKDILDGFNTLLTENYKKNISKTTHPQARNGKAEIYKSFSQIQSRDLELLKNSDEQIGIEKYDLAALLSDYIKEHTKGRKFGFYVTPDKRNDIKLYINSYDRKEFKGQGLDNSFYNNEDSIMFKFKTKKITLRKPAYLFSSEEQPNIVSVELKDKSLENETIESFLRKLCNKKQEELQRKKDYNDRIENGKREAKEKFENKLKELGISEEDFNELSNLHRQSK